MKHPNENYSRIFALLKLMCLSIAIVLAVEFTLNRE